jgi:nitrate reductase NapAB chaperone NapD
MVTQPDVEWHVSGLLIAAYPGRLDEVAHGVAVVTGAAVHARDEARSRLVITLEGESLDAQQATCAWLAGLPGVAAVDLVCHYVAGEESHDRA